MTDIKQPEALRLAVLMDRGGLTASVEFMAADELRRQHVVIQTLRAALEWIANKADNAKDNPRQLTGALFDVRDAARAALDQSNKGE